MLNDSVNREVSRRLPFCHRFVQSFVIESRTPVSELPFSSLTRFFGGSTVTRLSTVLPGSALTADAEFDTPFEGDVPSVRFVQSSVESGYRTASVASFPALFFLGLWRRRRPRS